MCCFHFIPTKDEQLAKRIKADYEISIEIHLCNCINIYMAFYKFELKSLVHAI